MFVLYSNAAELVGKYKVDIAHLEEIIEAKNTELETLKTSLQFTKTTLSTQIKELHEKCEMSEQQKGDSEILWLLFGSKVTSHNSHLDGLFQLRGHFCS